MFSSRVYSRFTAISEASITHKSQASAVVAAHAVVLRIALVVAMVSVFLLSQGLNASPAHAQSNPRYASIVVDADTGQVLSERYADRPRHPASITKVMTLMLMFDAIEDGRVGMKDRIRISSHAASMVPSKLGLAVGSTIRVEDAILALVTKSANDIAAAMAEHLGGNERNFARMMTNKARQIGMKNTTFRNASGLHHPEQVTTVRDIAIMSRVMIKSYPKYYKYFSTKNFVYQGQTYRNHNRLMETYRGMDGLKTGYIGASGFNLAASAKRGNTRLIGVVFGGRTTQSRNAHMAELLNTAFKKVGTKGGNDTGGQNNELSAPQVMASRNLKTAHVPIPPRKPALLRAIASLNTIAPSGNAEVTSRTAGNMPQLALNTLQLPNTMEYAGEGDIDSVISARAAQSGVLNTGAASTDAKSDAIQRAQDNARRTIQPARIQVPPPELSNSWSIQIGAFASRAQTDIALGRAVQTLPEHLRVAQPVIVPTKRGNAWLFRARLNGYTETQAIAACSHLKDCITIRPSHVQ